MSDWKAREEATYWAKVPHQQAYKIYTILIEQKVKEGYGDLLWKRFMPPPYRLLVHKKVFMKG